MKNLRIVSLTLIFVLACSLSFAQKSKKEKVDYKYTQLPMEPIAPEIKNYAPLVIIGYAAEEEEKAKIYAEEKVAADKKFEEDKKEYKNKSFGKKLLEKAILEEGKPQKDRVEKPTYKPSYNVVSIANTYLKLEGYEKADDNAITYEVTLNGLQSSDPVVKNGSYKTKEGAVINEYWWEVTYNYPMSVRLEVDGEEILNEDIEEFEKENTYTSKKYKSPYALRKSITPNAVMKTVDNMALKKNLKFINRKINETYGFMQKKKKTVVYVGKGKKHDYTELVKAYIAVEQALVGYNEGEGLDKLKEAVAIWGKALEEQDIDNKKAKISRSVAFGLNLNLIEYNVLLSDFSAAKKAINNLLLMNPSKSESKKIDKYKDFYQDMKDRFEANNP